MVNIPILSELAFGRPSLIALLSVHFLECIFSLSLSEKKCCGSLSWKQHKPASSRGFSAEWFLLFHFECGRRLSHAYNSVPRQMCARHSPILTAHLLGQAKTYFSDLLPITGRQNNFETYSIFSPEDEPCFHCLFDWKQMWNNVYHK